MPSGAPTSRRSKRLRADRPASAGRARSSFSNSTVYPGLTREFCGPLLAKPRGSGRGSISSSAIRPSGSIPATSSTGSKRSSRSSPARMPRLWSASPPSMARIVEAGVYRASSLEVAEAAKVIENTQRDLNIALMNELAIIFDRLGIPTKEVLQAAGTKWNFLPFTPGPGRRPLHRRRPLLPDRAGRGGRAITRRSSCRAGASMTAWAALSRSVWSSC